MAAAKKTATRKRTAPDPDRPVPMPETPEVVKLDPVAVLNRYHQKVAATVGEATAGIYLDAAKLEAQVHGEVAP